MTAKKYKYVSLTPLQRKVFNEFWNANKLLFEGTKKSKIIPIWKDGYICGKYSKKWSK